MDNLWRSYPLSNFFSVHFQCLTFPDMLKYQKASSPK